MIKTAYAVKATAKTPQPVAEKQNNTPPSNVVELASVKPSAQALPVDTLPAERLPTKTIPVVNNAPEQTVQVAREQTEYVEKQIDKPVNKSIAKTETLRQADDSLNWSNLAFELELDGIARQFAMNCVVKSFADNRLQLIYLPELEIMLKPDIEAQIKQAIEHKLGVSLNLEFASTTSLDCETPQQADVRKQEQHRQLTIQSIQQDPVVMQLKTVFGAELVEDSVKKIN